MVVGLSGGGDSMALVALLDRYFSETGAIQAVHLVHIDHGLRTGSGEEAAWVRAYVRDRFGREVEVVPIRVTPARGESLEMAARRERRTALETVRQAQKARFVALAHQRDDQAETVLMRIATGTGMAGLAAMSGREGSLIRPLLGMSRRRLREYLEDQGVRWLEDPSNADRAALRNRIRHQILPQLREAVNPEVDEALCRLAAQARSWREWLEAEGTEYLRRAEVDLNEVPLRFPADWRHLGDPLRGFLLQQFGERHGLRLEWVHLAPVLAGRAAQWPKGFAARPEPTGGLVIGRIPPRDAFAAPPAGGEAVEWRMGRLTWWSGDLRIEPEGEGGEREAAYCSVLRKPPGAVWWIRRWRAGDRLQPVGLGGHKKVQDVFVDRKIPRPLRLAWPVVVDMEDRVVSVVGLADDVAARAAGTAFRVTYIPAESAASPEGTRA